MSRKQKLIDRLQQFPADFTWDEAVKLMKMCGFEVLNNTGSRRKFRHSTGVKASLHEPHPQNILKKYMMEAVVDALRTVGEIK